MDFKISIIEGLNVKTLDMKGASQTSEREVISNFFGDISNHEEVEKVSGKSEKQPRIIESGTKTESDKDKSRSRRLPLKGMESRTSFLVEDIAGQSEQEDTPEHWRTGIKTDEDGTKRYKCRYFCECGGESNHYIPLETNWVDCRECGASMPVEEATSNVDENGVPERDGFGNFFVAKSN